MSSVGNHVREGPAAAWAEALDGAALPAKVGPVEQRLINQFYA